MCIFVPSILVLVAIFEMRTIFMTRPPPSLISALFFDCVSLCILLFYPSSSDDICQKDHFRELPTTLTWYVVFFVVRVHFFESIIEL